MLLQHCAGRLIKSVLKEMYSDYTLIYLVEKSERKEEEENVIHVYLFEGDIPLNNDIAKGTIPVIYDDNVVALIDRKYIDFYKYINAAHLSPIVNYIITHDYNHEMPAYTYNKIQSYIRPAGIEEIQPKDTISKLERIVSLALKKKYRNIQFRIVEYPTQQVDNAIVAVYDQLQLEYKFLSSYSKIYSISDYDYYVKTSMINKRYLRYIKKYTNTKISVEYNNSTEPMYEFFSDAAKAVNFDNFVFIENCSYCDFYRLSTNSYFGKHNMVILKTDAKYADDSNTLQLLHDVENGFYYYIANIGDVNKAIYKLFKED